MLLLGTAEMANGLARGKLIVGDASGDPSALTVGTADQVLQSDGSDAAWADLSTNSVASCTNRLLIYSSNAGKGLSNLIQQPSADYY